MIPLISKRSAHGRGPGALRQVGHRRSPRSSGHRHDGTVSVDLSGELSVVKRCALITHGGGGDDDMTQRHPGSTAPAPPQATKVCASAAIAFSMCSTARDAPTPGWNTARETLGWVRTEMSAPPNSRENLLCARWVTSGATMTSGKAHHHPLWEQLVQDERAGRHQREWRSNRRSRRREQRRTHRQKRIFLRRLEIWTRKRPRDEPHLAGTQRRGRSPTYP